jgi:hypothetical protein
MAAIAKAAPPTEKEIAARRTLDDRDEVDRARGYRKRGSTKEHRVPAR